MQEITEEEFENITWGDEYEAITDENIVSKGRWECYYEQIFRLKKDNSTWKITWKTGSTECQETDLDAKIVRVYPHTVETVVYKTEK